jgi:hypothetical protein
MISTDWWRTYPEPDIHEIIACFYEFAGYRVTNTHKAGASQERGVDLFVEKSGERIAIQVKKKPKGNDRAQLLDLCRIDCTKRIYVYTEDPVRSFVEEMNKVKVKERVEFWDTHTTVEQLHKLMPYGLTLMMLSHSEPVKTVLRIVETIESIVLRGMELSSEDHQKLSEKLGVIQTIPQLIWEGKDFTSSFHKTTKYLYQVLEKQLEGGVGNNRSYGLLPEIYEEIRALDKDILRRFEKTIALLVRDASDYLLRLVSATRLRSVWITFYHYRNEALGFHSDGFSTIHRWRSSSNVRSYSSDMEDAMRGRESSAGVVCFFRELSKVARDFELLIDWLYDSYVNPEFDDTHTDWK